MSYPLWATPERRAYLVQLFLDSGGFCVHGHGIFCPQLRKHGYEFFSEELIDWWKADDREERAYLHRLETRRIHAAPRIRRRGQFDSIRREQYLADRPQFILLGIGVNAFTQHRVAKVEIPELDKVVWVDISRVNLSKNRLRKLTRHARQSRGVPQEIYDQVAKAVRRHI